FHIVAVEPADARPAAGGSLLSRRRRRLSAKELALFTRQLATLAEVAPLEEALRTLTRQSEAESARLVIGDVHAGLLEGRRLADAMARQSGSFPPLYRAMVAAGETTGSLTVILTRLADRKSTRLNSSHVKTSYAVFCLKKKKKIRESATVSSTDK